MQISLLGFVSIIYPLTTRQIKRTKFRYLWRVVVLYFYLFFSTCNILAIIWSWKAKEVIAEFSISNWSQHLLYLTSPRSVSCHVQSDWMYWNMLPNHVIFMITTNIDLVAPSLPLSCVKVILWFDESAKLFFHVYSCVQILIVLCVCVH